jgi:hypothetical protein
MSVTAITGPGLLVVLVKAILRLSGAHDGWSPPNVFGSAVAPLPSGCMTKICDPPVGFA